VHGAWQVVHGILAFGREFPLQHDGTESAAVDYLLDGGRLTGWNLRSGSPGVVAVVEEGSTTGQGHPDQWLGYLSQCGRHGIPHGDDATRCDSGGARALLNSPETLSQS
jgi:hypothetical protein